MGVEEKELLIRFSDRSWKLKNPTLSLFPWSFQPRVLRDNFHRRFLFKKRRSFVSRTYYFRFLRWIALKRDREVEGKWEEKDRKSFHDIKITTHSVSYRANDKTFSLYVPSKPCLPISFSRVCAFTNSFDYINYEFPFFSSLSLFLRFFSSSIKFYRIVVQ